MGKGHRGDNSISAIELSKKYQKFCLDCISFEAKPGEITALVGANGAGKTTLLSILTDQRMADKGQVLYGEYDLQKHKIQIKKQLGAVHDYNCFYEKYTCKDIRTIMKGFYEEWSDIHFNKLLDIFELPAKLPLSNFSQGMKKKVMFSTALSHNAQFLVLDEITSELDPVTRNDIMGILKEQAEQGVAVLLSTHITNDADHYADRVLMLDQGRLVLNETLDEIRTRYFIAEFSAEEYQKGKRLSRELCAPFAKLGYRYLLLTKKEKLKNIACRKVEPTIEDIMMVYIQGGRDEDLDCID